MEAADAEKARRRELHRKSMIVTGALIAGSALAAAWLGFAPSWLVPRFRLGAAGPTPNPEAKLAPMAVRWRPFGARRDDRLTLLNLAAAWSAPSRVMDGTAYADPEVAKLLDERFVAVRVDADERPDLALRYLGQGWPTTALLLPSGEVLADGTFMDAALLKQWATEIAQKYEEKRADVLASQEQARRQRAQAAEGAPLSREAAYARAARALVSTWAGPTVFPRFDRLGALASVKASWAAPLEKQGLAAALALQDGDGGFLRDRGPAPTADTEKRLGDQADALAYLAKAQPGAAARLRGFVDARLALPGGGYRSAVWKGGQDERAFCDESARMAAAMLGDPAATPAEKRHARRTIAAFWSGRVKGLARRGLKDGVRGLLGDQLGLLEGLIAAGRAAEARALEGAIERELLAADGRAFYDRPERRELFGDLDRIPFGGLNARARRDLTTLGMAERAQAVKGWLWSHADGLDAGELALLAQGERDDRMDAGGGPGGGSPR